ncbi:hypothetical protein, partial [Pseudogemmobacter sonorensis]|uniref:hypothetical protein n=1 Tax=Pseudogemmobacter sonorensis TaxID=2989681 RepID=UPI0036B2A6FD
MSTTPTPEGDLISRAAALAIFQPETSTVRKQICDDIRALPASQPQGEDKPAPAMDLAPEATEACAEQTEIVIKALRAAAR